MTDDLDLQDEALKAVHGWFAYQEQLRHVIGKPAHPTMPCADCAHSASSVPWPGLPSGEAPCCYCVRNHDVEEWRSHAISASKQTLSEIWTRPLVDNYRTLDVLRQWRDEIDHCRSVINEFDKVESVFRHIQAIDERAEEIPDVQTITPDQTNNER